MNATENEKKKKKKNYLTHVPLLISLMGTDKSEV